MANIKEKAYLLQGNNYWSSIQARAPGKILAKDGEATPKERGKLRRQFGRVRRTVWLFWLFNSGSQQELKSGVRRVNSISQKWLICVAEPICKHSRPREFCRPGGAE